MKWRSLDESNPSTEKRALREILAERKNLVEKYVPVETREVYARVVAELKGQHLAQNALQKGDAAPFFELQDQNGATVSLAQLLAKGRVVVFFVRGRWCPFCVGQMEAMNGIAPQIKETGAVVVAISPQTVKQSFFMHDQHKLSFPLLSDPGNRVARKFGLVYQVPEYQQAIYKRAFVNLPLANGDESWELPVPATFVIDGDGTARYASINEDYTERPEPADILHAVRTGEL
jgi:peroxiredoxin